MITLTDAAVMQLQTLVGEQDDATKGLRIFVESGGCAGMQYGMSLDHPNRRRRDRRARRSEGDHRSGERALFCAGSTVDYADDLAGAGFRIKNPNAVRSCGCGTSFEAGDGAEHSHAEGASTLKPKAGAKISRGLKMANDLYGYDDDDAPPRGKDNLFLWTVFILLLIGLAFACWLGSFYIFGHPENPKAYRILKKLHKLDPPKRFEVTAAPRGDFLSAQKLFERYGTMTRLELEQENGELLRNYIKNYRDVKKLVPVR